MPRTSGKAKVDKPEKVEKVDKLEKLEKASKTTDALTRAERKALEEQIRSAKQALLLDKATRPKKQLTQKQLDNLAAGRAKNPKFRPKKEGKKAAPTIPRGSLTERLEKQSKDGNISNGHIAPGYSK